MTAAGGRSSAVRDAVGWSPERWARLADRMELRQAGVGLRFWGPPMWLEVTMTGPDSDRWPATDGGEQDWNWQSNVDCLEAAELAASGAGDDEVLDALSRYTFENLLLNAVHEIGEWFRLDGRRVVPSHTTTDVEGNGAVRAEVTFHRAAPPRADIVLLAPRALSRITAAVPPSRFTYLPATFVSYATAGPVVREAASRDACWQSTWAAAAASGDPELLEVVITRDVHRALVEHEADRICRDFHVDGARRFALGDPRRTGVSIDLSYASGVLADASA